MADYNSDEEILKRALEEYKMCVDADGDSRIDAIDDLRFLSGGEAQWDDAGLAQRKRDGRPVITVNMLPSFLHQVTNDQRMNTPAIKVHPVGGKADADTARVRQGMIRHIEYDSNADIAYDRAVNSAAAIGFGFWRLVTKYMSDTSFDQKICFQSIRNPLSVRIDPLSTEPDGSDMRFAFVEYLEKKTAFEREYPKAKACDTDGLQGNEAYAGWLSNESVLICDYYCIEETDDELVLLSNGESGLKSKLLELPEGVSIVRTRPTKVRRVMLYKVTALDVLEKTEIKCKWIPVFPVYGDEIDIEGKVIRSGIIRHAKGPQKSYNVMMSGATEEIALRSKSPYIGAEGQFDGYEEDWAQANSRAFPYLEYKPTTVDGTLAPPPQRQPMADVPAGMLAMSLHAKDNVKSTTGLFDASLGARGTATSGIQEKAQQQQGDVANFHYSDGLLRTILHCGRCINSMIPHYYDTQRVVAILSDDDTMEFETINQPNDNPVPDPKTGAIQYVLNDMTGGEFDVTVSAGPSYSTLRQEAAEGMAQNMAKNPALWGVIGDLYVKNQDWPGADAMAERIKKTIPPQLLEEEEDQPPEVIQTPNGPVPVAQVPQMLEQMQIELQMAQEAIQKAQADKQQSEVMKQQNAQGSLSIDAERLEVEKYNAETERIKVEKDAENERIRLLADAEKERTEQLRIQADALAKQSENETASREKESEPSLEDMAQLIIASRPQISGMKITAPSGGVYAVEVMNGPETVQ